MFEVMTLT